MPRNTRTVAIDSCPESAFRYLDRDAIVCIDVIRASTTLVTSVVTGRRTIPASDFEAAAAMAGGLKDPILAGEAADEALEHYEIANSPAELSLRTDTWRPLILASSTGTRLLSNAFGRSTVFVACLRNLEATAEALLQYDSIALVGAGSASHARCEDQMAAARIGAMLLDSDYRPGSARTAATIQRWSRVDIDLLRLGRSAEYLRKTGQHADLEFILEHDGDVDVACQYDGLEVVAHDSSRPQLPHTAAAEDRRASA